jgi:hypothetical protein
MATTRKSKAASPARRSQVAQLPEQSHGRPYAERTAAGRSLRQRSPRRAIADWKPAAPIRSTC